MRKPWILVSLLLLAGSFSAHALQPDTPFAQYDRTPWFTEHGLPQTSVLAIAQDHAGYLWFATQGGLGRFDGLRFTTYTSDTDPELPGNWIHALEVDPRGRLWVGTYKGLAVRDPRGFTAVPAADAERWPELDVQAIVAGDDGAVLVGTTSGLFELAGEVLQPVGGAPETASALLLAGDVLWVGGEGNVHRRDGNGWQALPLPGEARVLSLAHA